MQERTGDEKRIKAKMVAEVREGGGRYWNINQKRDEWAWRLREGGMSKLVEGLKAELRRTDINKLH